MEQATQLSIDFQEALRKIRVHWLAHKVHEMRGPLFAVRGYTKLLIEEKGGEVTVTQRRYLTTILENINKLGGCADSLQEFAAQEELSLELLDFGELLRLAVADWRRQEQTIRLTDQVLPGPALTTGDRAKLSFAVHKLLGAMVEFSQSGGKIELQVKREEDELLMRLTASTNGPCEPTRLPDLTGACEVFRLHGGVASADGAHAGVFHITVRLPLIWPETAAARETFRPFKGK